MFVASPSPISGALGPAQTPSALTQQVPLLWAWAQKWGWLECCRVAMAKGAGENQEVTSGQWVVKAHALSDRSPGGILVPKGAWH